LVVRGADEPARDPIVSRSTSGIMLVCALLLMAVVGWSLYDEVYGQRGWKGLQREFVTRETRLLNRLRRQGNTTEKEVVQSEEYKQLEAEEQAAKAAAEPRRREIDSQVKFIDQRLAAITEPFQDKRGHLTVANYRAETAHGSGRKKYEDEAQEIKSEPAVVYMPASLGAKPQKQSLTYPQLDEMYTSLKAEKARLLAEQADVLRDYNDKKKAKEEYLKANVIGLSREQISNLLERNRKFDFGLKQINVNDYNVVDRCETCHLGVREPLVLRAADMKRPGKKVDDLARAFVSHPREKKELLDIHSPDKFGCASCHGGNGRATTSVEKAHGLNEFWLHPMHARENTEAGCQQCHANDRVLQFADKLTLGKDLFQQRGCVGCHRFEGYDREADALSGARQQIKQLEEQIAANEHLAREAELEAANATSDERAQLLNNRAQSLRVTSSQIAARVEELNTQARYLMQDQKKVGPNLKDVRLKLRKEWIPEWLKDPQAFRPGTKMPTFWYLNPDPAMSLHNAPKANDELKAISAYLWQSAFDGQPPKQDGGDAGRGKEMFETKGCMACHAIGEGDQAVGGEFAANLTRVGEKASFDYIVRWIHNPRERWAPYCPKEKRDLTREDYEKKGKPFVYDTGLHSKCPNDGAELQVQNMTVMPNFRLSVQDARDIATYLFSLGNTQSNYAAASYMDDPRLKDTGFTLIKQYGCAGCHEIKGFEEEQRIGKELTNEGATPLERLDFALMTNYAEDGKDPYTRKEKDKDGKEVGYWYNHKGFFEHKLADPSVYDRDKEKDARDHLRMPKPYLKPEWQTALTTFLLGSVGTEGANVPQSLFYNPTDRQKDIQDGWWVIKKYNCMGCHAVQVGQQSVLSGLPQFQTPEGKDQQPPALFTEGARVDPDWLLRFLTDPSLSGGGDVTAPGHAPNAGASRPSAGNANSGGASASGASAAGANGSSANASGANATAGPTTNAASGPGGRTYANEGGLAPQPGANRNGIRLYLKPRMPTFHFSPNELRTLVRFFMAIASAEQPHFKPQLEPLTDQERNMARAIFTSQQAPCLKCHLTGNAEHDKTATAPNFLDAAKRLQPGWTFRWLLDPQRVIPGTAMPSGLFRKAGERWVFSFDVPGSGLDTYEGDHAQLLTRYILELTPAEQARLAAGSPSSTAGRTPQGTTPPANAPPPASTHHGPRLNHAAPRRRLQRRQAATAPARVRQRARASDLSVLVRRDASGFTVSPNGA
jgi:cytochrome c2